MHLVPTAQPVLYWCARNMSVWSSISFNLAVLMNLLVAFFYPFKGVRGGTSLRVQGRLPEAAEQLCPAPSLGSPGTINAMCGVPVTPFRQDEIVAFATSLVVKSDFKMTESFCPYLLTKKERSCTLLDL